MKQLLRVTLILLLCKNYLKNNNLCQNNSKNINKKKRNNSSKSNKLGQTLMNKINLNQN
jgi:hypothetical protein